MAGIPPEPKARRTFLGSLEEQPFKTIITLNTSTLIYSYVGVTVFALWFGPIDFSDPLKGMFIVTILTDITNLSNDFYLAYKARSLVLLWDSGGRVLFQIVTLVTAAGVLVKFILTPIAVSTPNLSQLGLDPTSKTLISIAALTSILFTARPVSEFIRILRERVS